MDGEVTDVEGDKEEKGEDDIVKILGASSQGPIRARLEEISSSDSSEISLFSPLPLPLLCTSPSNP